MSNLTHLEEAHGEYRHHHGRHEATHRFRRTLVRDFWLIVVILLATWAFNFLLQLGDYKAPYEPKDTAREELLRLRDAVKKK